MCDHFRTPGESIYICPARLERLRSLPWGSEQFDVFLVVLDASFMSDDLEGILIDLVKRNSDWIETFGNGAEELHDRIDRIGVLVGRQDAVGDGNPMTAWHEDLVSREEIVEREARARRHHGRSDDCEGGPWDPAAEDRASCGSPGCALDSGTGRTHPGFTLYLGTDSILLTTA